LDTAIHIENVSKLYRLGNIGTGTIHGDLKRWWAQVRGNEDPFAKIGVTNTISSSNTTNYVWALKDINFAINQGDIVGIIGKNGAGKSTLLKILSRVTTPTTGQINIHGRIASLLEVGTGFHPELSGRENIFLNGAILGMTKPEIRSKFDEIVDFAGVERYIDTPVKRYSSGMFVRLAFAVAAHLEPEILIIDEVLAVGDAEFQKKALGKMKDVSTNQGRTVLFVSHNMTAIKSLCSRGIILKNGLVDFSGGINDAVTFYTSNHKKIANQRIWGNLEHNHQEFELGEASIKGLGKHIEDVIEITEAIEIMVTFENKTQHSRIDTTLHVKDGNGEKIFMITSGVIPHIRTNGTITLQCIIPPNFFNNGNFTVDFFLVKDRKTFIYTEIDCLEFTLVNKPIALGHYMGEEPGALRPIFDWKEVDY